MQGFRYLLRAVIVPGYNEHEKIERLLRFCKEAKIDNIMFFTNGEELNNGHLTYDEEKVWIDLIGKAQKELEEIGVTTSINPWSTILHAARGRKLKEGQNFTTIVYADGYRDPVCACPLDENFKNYISEIFSLCASVEPEVIWIDDDFRLHNHEPGYWGGCFCDLHIKKFSEYLGEKVTREDFIKGMLEPGKPHPYRQAWLNVNRDAMIELAETLEKAVHKISPKTALGLMSSNPSVHAAEGRDWKGIFRALSGGKTSMINRPPLPAYSDFNPGNYLWAFSWMSKGTQACVPEGTILYPELENFPFTRFSKSHKSTRFQMLLALVLGIDGITLDLFDFLGNGINVQENYQDLLSKNKSFLEMVSDLDLRYEYQRGIKVLFSDKASYFKETIQGKEISEMQNDDEFAWSSLLSSLGFSTVLNGSCIQKNEIVAISGQYLRNLSLKEIKDLFKNNMIILDALSASILYEIGHGNLAGIKRTNWVEHTKNIHSFEEITDGNIYSGCKNPRISAQLATGNYLKIEYEEAAKIKSVLKSPLQKGIGAGVTVYKNVLIFPYELSAIRQASYFHLNPYRQGQIQRLLKSLVESSENLTFSCNDPYIATYRFQHQKQTIIFMANCSHDNVEKVEFIAGNLEFSEEKSYVLGSIDMKKHSLCIQKIANGNFILDSGLKSMEIKVLIFGS